jgi:hypothetical protein
MHCQSPVQLARGAACCNGYTKVLWRLLSRLLLLLVLVTLLGSLLCLLSLLILLILLSLRLFRKPPQISGV